MKWITLVGQPPTAPIFGAYDTPKCDAAMTHRRDRQTMKLPEDMGRPLYSS